jgi:hypothetical protein
VIGTRRIVVSLVMMSISIGADHADAQAITTIGGIERIPRVEPKELQGGKCQPTGKARTKALLDPQTNLLKNRIDGGDYWRTTIATLLKLPWKSVDMPTKHMATRRTRWTANELARAQRYEARPVSVDGFIVAIHAERKEATNCEIADTAWVDWHFWIVATEAEASNPDTSRRKIHAVVGEVTPRVRAAHHADFNRALIMKWARDGIRVRVSGWTMLDPDHPDDAEPDRSGRPASRGTIWELHPVMKIAPVRR